MLPFGFIPPQPVHPARDMVNIQRGRAVGQMEGYARAVRDMRGRGGNPSITFSPATPGRSRSDSKFEPQTKDAYKKNIEHKAKQNEYRQRLESELRKRQEYEAQKDYERKKYEAEKYQYERCKQMKYEAGKQMGMWDWDSERNSALLSNEEDIQMHLRQQEAKMRKYLQEKEAAKQRRAEWERQEMARQGRYGRGPMQRGSAPRGAQFDPSRMQQQEQAGRSYRDPDWQRRGYGY